VTYLNFVVFTLLSWRTTYTRRTAAVTI